MCIGGRTPTQGAHPSAGAAAARRAQWLTSIVAGGAYHPSPKPNVPRSAGVRAESPKRVWVSRLSGWGLRFVPNPSEGDFGIFWARHRFGRVQADGRRMCILKVLLEKRREMRELVSGMVCAASEQSNVLLCRSG